MGFCGAAAAAAAAAAAHGISISGNHCKWKTYFNKSTRRRRNGDADFANGIPRKNNHMILTVRAEAYKRIPMETAGTYRVIDERSTAQEFVVWGGDDDIGDHSSSPSSPLPSQQALSWNPKPQQEVQGTGIGITSAAASAAALPSFARLKAPKIKAIINKKSSSSPKTVTDIATNSKQMGIPPPASNSFRERNDKRIQKKKTILQQQDKKNRDGDGEVAAPEYVHVPPAPRAAASSGLRGWSNFSTCLPNGNAAIAQHMQRPRKMAADNSFFSRKYFKDLQCSDDMIEALRSLAFTRPSHIQAVAFAPVLRGKSCIIADQSGSGKTLAYLVPIIQRLKQEELQGLGRSLSRSPRVVILVPTAELASQVLNNCRAISKNGVPFRSMVATGGFRQKTQLDSLQQDLDVLIATPGRFIYLLQEGFVQLTNIKCVVLDEVDILFGDEGFEQVLQILITSAPMEAQYLFVTATLPVDIYNKLVQVFPDCEVTMGPGIHRTSSRLEEVLVDCSGDGMEKNPETAFLNKKSALLQLAEESPVPRTIVFCNKIETCRKVENILNRFDRKGINIKVLPFHAALAQDIRLTNMNEFLNSKSKDPLFFICTDRASRGIDFPNVDHVVLFDFPRDPSEYVRRVGRTARGAGGKGKAFVFVVGKQVPLARRIMERNQKGHPLHNVPSAYELESSVH